MGALINLSSVLGLDRPTAPERGRLGDTSTLAVPASIIVLGVTLGTTAVHKVIALTRRVNLLVVVPVAA